MITDQLRQLPPPLRAMAIAELMRRFSVQMHTAAEILHDGHFQKLLVDR